MDADVIRQIPLCHTNQSDSWGWHYEKNGEFSVRSCYRLLVQTKSRREAWLRGETENSNAEKQATNWLKLWKVRVPPKLRLFAWRLVRSSLSTGEERARRHIWRRRRSVLSATRLIILGGMLCKTVTWLNLYGLFETTIPRWSCMEMKRRMPSCGWLGCATL